MIGEELIRPDVLLAIKAALALISGVVAWLVYRGLRSLGK